MSCKFLRNCRHDATYVALAGVIFGIFFAYFGLFFFYLGRAFRQLRAHNYRCKAGHKFSCRVEAPHELRLLFIVAVVSGGELLFQVF